MGFGSNMERVDLTNSKAIENYLKGKTVKSMSNYTINWTTPGRTRFDIWRMEFTDGTVLSYDGKMYEILKPSK